MSEVCVSTGKYDKEKGLEFDDHARVKTKGNHRRVKNNAIDNVQVEKDMEEIGE